MHKRILSWFGTGPAARQRLITTLIVVAAALLMMTGSGKDILHSHDNMGNADRLAAVTLIMSGVPRQALPVTFLDVDDRTRRAWGADVITPHAGLAELVKLAAAKDAKAILVDFDLSGGNADAVFSDLLRAYPANAPLLMLVRNIAFERSGEGTLDVSIAASGTTPTPYDVAASDKANVVWISTLNDIGPDRTVRRIRLWQTVCDGAFGAAFPSAELVLAARLLDGGRNDGKLEPFLQARVAEDCGKVAKTAMAWPPVQAQAVTLPFVFADTTETPALFRIVSDGHETIALRRISAGQLVNYGDGVAKLAGDVDRDPFEGRVTIIGASYTGSRDLYDTPLGTMPGGLILANSIVQAKTIIETRPLAPLVANIFTVILFLLCAAAARYPAGVVALTAIFALALLGLFVVSRMFGFAAGFDVVAVALPGFALFKVIDAIVHVGLDVPAHRWRALLKR